MTLRSDFGDAPREQLERRQQDAQPRLRQLERVLHAAGVGLWDWDLRSNGVFRSAEWYRQLGEEPDERSRDVSEWYGRLHPDDVERVRDSLRAFASAPHASCTLEYRLRHRNGEYRWLRMDGMSVCDESGQPVRLQGVQLDITEHKRAELALKSSEQRLRFAIEGGDLCTFHWDLREGEMEWSERCACLLGIPPGTAPSYESFLRALHPADRERVDEALRSASLARTDYDLEVRTLSPAGSLHWVRFKGRVYDDGTGKPLRMEGIALDITARRNAAQALLATEQQRLRLMTDAVPHLIWELAQDGSLAWVNKRFREYLGRPNLIPSEWAEVVHPQDLGKGIDEWQKLLRAEVPCASFECRLLGIDGAYRWFTVRSLLVSDAAGQCVAVMGTATDIDDLKSAEGALRDAQTHLQSALAAAGMATWTWSVDDNSKVWNESLERLLDRKDETIGRTAAGLSDAVHVEDRATLQHALEQTVRTGCPLQVEFRAVRPDGATRWLAAQGRLERDAEGKPLRIVGASVDITHHKQLEAELRQAQKMEAIGQLAGGVAHDFNNILTIILGEASLLRLRAGLAPEAAKHIHSIVSAAERAASLTAQLLAFGRRRIMHLRELDLNEVVNEFIAMVKRMLGEDITLAFAPAPHPVWVRADPSMLSQALLNLAVNARDAMPGGGRLLFRTSLEVLDEPTAAKVPGVQSGTWACLRVSDTGSGIPAHVLPHVFEPFFTTKEVGKGTGLGLATVHGVVTQHGGRINLESAPGRGATFEILLPAIAHHVLPERVAPNNEGLRGRGETILLVEDEAGVRDVLKNILEQHGYEVLVTDNGQEARAAFKQNAQRISLLLTDVVMPGGLSGADLVDLLRAENPTLKAVLSSGYGTQALGSHFVPRHGVSFLRKPYKAEELLRHMRQVLDDESASPRSDEVALTSPTGVQRKV